MSFPIFGFIDDASFAGQRMRVADLDLGRGPPLLCLRGTLGDFRMLAAVMGPLSQKPRVIAVSLRHFFPERWDGNGGNHTNRLFEKASALHWKMEHAEIASDPVR